MSVKKTDRPCRVSPRPGGSTAEPPRSLAGLLETGAEASEWQACAETLALVLPMFQRVAAITTGPHALLSARGGYGPVRLAGQQPIAPSGRIGLRVLAGRGERVVMTGAVPERCQPAAIWLFGAEGELRHRVEIADPEDLLVLAALSADLGAARVTAAPTAPEIAPAQPSIPEIRRLQQEWDWMAPAAHLDQILLDGGRRRAAALRHVGARAARPVPVEHLGRLLQHLAETGVPFGRSVLRPGCAQSHYGPMERVPVAAGPLVFRSGASLFALDPAGVAACWVTERQGAVGPESVMEVYDPNGGCLALFEGPRGARAEAVMWNKLLGVVAGA